MVSEWGGVRGLVSWTWTPKSLYTSFGVGPWTPKSLYTSLGVGGVSELRNAPPPRSKVRMIQKHQTSLGRSQGHFWALPSTVPTVKRRKTDLGWAEWLFEHVCTALHCLAAFHPFQAISGSEDISWTRRIRLPKQKEA